MIQVNGLTKKFGDFTALSALDCTIPAGCIYGLVGSNGAGKSTLLRLICGIYRPDKGNVTLDGRNIYENPELKEKLVFVPDELYFLPQANMLRMAQTYASFYPRFDRSRFGELTDAFKLNPKANLGTFSKGMRRQAATVLALACKTDFLFLDETFDGLDPIMRNLVKKVLYADVAERGVTAVGHETLDTDGSADVRARGARLREVRARVRSLSGRGHGEPRQAALDGRRDLRGSPEVRQVPGFPAPCMGGRAQRGLSAIEAQSAARGSRGLRRARI